MRGSGTWCAQCDDHRAQHASSGYGIAAAISRRCGGPKAAEVAAVAAAAVVVAAVVTASVEGGGKWLTSEFLSCALS